MVLHLQEFDQVVSLQPPTFDGSNTVVVAQLVRASDCDSEGRGFEPHHPPQLISRLVRRLPQDRFQAPFRVLGSDRLFDGQSFASRQLFHPGSLMRHNTQLSRSRGWFCAIEALSSAVRAIDS